MNEREEIIAEISQTMRTMKHSMHGKLSKKIHDCPVSRAQLELLFVIDREQPASFKRLAESLSLTAGAVSQLAEGLEANGFIKRETDASDRRVQTLSLSKKGAGLFKTLEASNRELLTEIMSTLTTSELKTFLRLERKIIKSINDK